MRSPLSVTARVVTLKGSSAPRRASIYGLEHRLRPSAPLESPPSGWYGYECGSQHTIELTEAELRQDAVDPHPEFTAAAS